MLDTNSWFESSDKTNEGQFTGKERAQTGSTPLQYYVKTDLEEGKPQTHSQLAIGIFVGVMVGGFHLRLFFGACAHVCVRRFYT